MASDGLALDFAAPGHYGRAPPTTVQPADAAVGRPPPNAPGRGQCCRIAHRYTHPHTHHRERAASPWAPGGVSPNNVHDRQAGGGLRVLSTFEVRRVRRVRVTAGSGPADSGPTPKRDLRLKRPGRARGGK